MDTTNINLEERPSHRLEVRDRAALVNFREGPYICHNTLVTHAEFLKAANDAKEPRVFRVLPVGGANSNIGDVFALVTWYFLCVYSCCVIPIACYCENTVINIVNTTVSCVLLMYHITAIYAITKNRKKVRRMLCLAETTADRYQGYQNYFFDVRSNNTEQLSFLNLKHRRKLQQEIVIRQGKGMVVMLCTKSYWRSRIIYPIVCLSVLSVLSLIGVIVQLETMKRISG
ncbi:uncharacterized protein LOC117325187 [Pecten maximus]|uniref:uncharacterized protein LOC117325187 n=1 Tax=Pecten maximus TaxID=6579 RepID=UPI001458B17B|nr:uncharacterized protein LOC117325187 [Pecten maximus]XP_033737079.1 uncharacterized protein LOC117325187 [Pecten maximus]XP_033737080.1 uncharacterized protein LOC117325187 [Pecten maximus]XP_033737081.1 uncharacterized protein LOC117325187 [Pecten maximus]XP_033737082.1 uncharacterized protein LOC117325187 [Pecten maximus]XP_033737083.1 uncharacterized protein LOC117325187 [Pecten maximus]